MNNNQILTVRHIRSVTRDLKTFVIEPERPLDYEAGQFITLLDKTHSAEIRRSYSMLSAPALQEPHTIAVRRIENGFFSRKLVDETRIGDRIETSGTGGFFRLPANLHAYRKILFFAAGSGIVPILPLIKTALYLNPQITVYLIYSNHSVLSAAFIPELRSLEKNYPGRLRMDFLFSTTPDLKKARLNREYLLDFLLVHGFEREPAVFYVCGPENYMRLIIFLLMEEGYQADFIRKEDFNPGNKKLSGRFPPDTGNHRVQLDLQGKRFDFEVKYPDSILRAARKLNINLPYSCETGKCGSCAAVCLSGNAWMSDNEVLTDQELKAGIRLTCTGYPQNGDLKLKIG